MQEREGVRAGKGQGQVMQGLVGPEENLGFYCPEARSQEGCGQRRP